MSQYPFDEQPPKKGSNVWFYIVLILIAAVVGGLFVQYLLPALRQPGADPQISVSPTPSPGVTETTTATTTTTTTTAAQQQAPSAGNLVNSNIEIDESASLPDVVDKVTPAVVAISNITERATVGGIVGTINGIPIPSQSGEGTKQEVEQGYGSGVIISTDGYIMTNAHVIDSASKLVVILDDGTEVVAELIGADTATDLALLKIEHEGLTAISLGDSDELRVAETVLAIGNPTGATLKNTVTKGIVSAKNRETSSTGTMMEMLQTDAAVNFGNSGGALINTRGELVGIVSEKRIYSGTDSYGNYVAAEGLGFAIPINEAMEIIEELKEHGYVERPYLGVSGGYLSEQGAAYYHCPVGYLVEYVEEGSGAAKAGLKPADIITAADGVTLTGVEELSEAITNKEVGDTIRLTIWRNGETLELEAVLGAAKPEAEE